MKYLSLLFLIAFAKLLTAQTPPQACARVLIGLGQDSIQWQASPCTAFGGYVILGQQNQLGAFVPLDTVFSLNYVHANPSEDIWNYKIGLICSGTLGSFSTIVNNQRPVTPDLRNVNIINNKPVVSWDASPSPEVVGYQLYKENPYGSTNYFPYPTANHIINSTSFVDQTATDLLARYALVAVSRCNKSLLGIGQSIDGTTGPHTSMIVSGSIDSCSQTISLAWNAYENWAAGVEQYEIWLSKNNGSFYKVDSVGSNTLQYRYPKAEDNSILDFQIRAVEALKNNVALSNSLHFNVSVNRPMDFIHLQNISVTANNSIDVQWNWDTNVDFQKAVLWRSIDSNQWATVATFNSLGTAQQNYDDSDVLPLENSYYYKIKSTDACGHSVYSNIGKNIQLKVATSANFENKISWSPAFIQYGTVQDYWLYKGSSRIAVLNANQTEYSDILRVENENEVKNCYQIIANIQLTYPNQSLAFSQSYANKSCVVQGSKIHIPNAISVNGVNNRFRPVIVFGQSILSYQMKIFDRYGAVIFESNNLYDAWDGSKQGQPIKQGVYIYFIRFQAPNGEWIERKGSLMLIR